MFLQFYGLSEQPFGVTPDPRFLYMGTAHHEAFQSLIYGIETGCGFMVLVAAPGLGKTTMLFRLMEKLRDSALTAFLFQIHTSSQEFLKNLLRDLDVEPAGQDMSDLQGQLHAVLMQGSQSGKRKEELCHGGFAPQPPVQRTGVIKPVPNAHVLTCEKLMKLVQINFYSDAVPVGQSADRPILAHAASSPGSKASRTTTACFQGAAAVLSGMAVNNRTYPISRVMKDRS